MDNIWNKLVNSRNINAVVIFAVTQNEAMSDNRLEAIDDRINKIESKIDKLVDLIDTNIGSINNNFQVLEDKIDALARNLDSLHGDTKKDFKEVKYELVKLQKITGYQDLYENLGVVDSGKTKK